MRFKFAVDSNISTREIEKNICYIQKYVISIQYFSELIYEKIKANISFETHHQNAKYCQKDSICLNKSTFNDGMMYP